MKKLLFTLFILSSTLFLSAKSIAWSASQNTNWMSEKIPFKVAVIDSIEESFYDSIALPYSVSNAEFDTLTTASLLSIPDAGVFPAVGFKFTVSKRTPLNFLFSSDSISMYAFIVSDSANLSNEITSMFNSGATDSIDAGVYYMALITNYQMGNYNLTISEDSIPSAFPVYNDVAFPFSLTDEEFSTVTATTLSVDDFGVYPAIGYKITIPNDTTISLFFESESINMYAFALSDTLPSALSGNDFFNNEGVFYSLTAGTYYITMITNNQYGDFNLVAIEGEFQDLMYDQINLPYSVQNLALNSLTAPVSVVDGSLTRALGYMFKLPVDTTIVIGLSSSDLMDYTYQLLDSSLNSIGYYYGNDTLDLSAGDYYLAIVSYEGAGSFDFSVAYEDGTTTSNKNAVQAASISVVNNTITVATKNDGDFVSIFTIGGQSLSSGKVRDGKFVTDLPASGVYVVNVNGQSSKVLIP